MARVAYDAAKSAGRIVRAKKAHDDVLAAVYRAQGHALEIEARAKIRLADEYDAAQDRGEVQPHGGQLPRDVAGNNIPSAADIGLRRYEIFEARQLRDAELAEPGIIERTIAERVESGEEPTKAALREVVHNHRAQGTSDNEWYTPAEYIEAARGMMGAIDMDPASSTAAQEVVRADVFFTSDDDGLKQPWSGRVYLNPPYSQPAIFDFMQKLVDEWDAGNVSEAIALTHNYTDTRWFHVAAGAASAICFTRGRIGFLSPEGKRAAPTQGQAFFYFGKNTTRFTAYFERFGFVMVKP